MLLPCNLVALNQKVKVTPMASFKDPRLGHLLAGESSYGDISCWRFASNSFRMLMCFLSRNSSDIVDCFNVLCSRNIHIYIYCVYQLFILYPYLCLDQMSLRQKSGGHPTKVCLHNLSTQGQILPTKPGSLKHLQEQS